MILIASARGFHVGGQFGNKPVQPVGKIPQQLGIFTLCQENILIPPVCGGRFTLSTQVVLIQVVTTQVVRGLLRRLISPASSNSERAVFTVMVLLSSAAAIFSMGNTR